MANSLVGIRINNDDCFDFKSNSIIGIEYAAVLPVPVWDEPSMSFPSNIKGIDFKEFSPSLIKKCVEILQPISFSKNQHKILLEEFRKELDDFGKIYMYRLKPQYEIKARSLNDFPHKSTFFYTNPCFPQKSMFFIKNPCFPQKSMFF